MIRQSAKFGLLPAAIGQKLFRFGANLLDIAVWPWSLKTIRELKVKAQQVKIAEVSCTWYTPAENRNPGKFLFYLHGGGFMIASTRTHGSFLAALADALSCTVLAIDYSLSPERQFPTALDEIQSVHSYLLTIGHSPKDILIGGDSAGGCLALALLYRLRDYGAGLPCGAFLDSPVTDLSFSGESMSKNWPHECLLPIFGPFTASLYKRTFLNYTDGARVDAPYVSPLFGSLKALPPMHISYSDHEVFRDDAKRLIALARSENATITDYSCVWAPHAPLTLGRFYPEGRDLFHAVCKFIRQHLDLVN